MSPISFKERSIALFSVVVLTAAPAVAQSPADDAGSVGIGTFLRVILLLVAVGAFLIWRRGKPPEEVQHLLHIVSIKMLCRIANVQAVDAGAKGASIALRNGIFPNPAKLVEWINGQGTLAKLRPDMKLVIMRDWSTPEQRLKGTRQLMQTLVKLAA